MCDERIDASRRQKTIVWRALIGFALAAAPLLLPPEALAQAGCGPNGAGSDVVCATNDADGFNHGMTDFNSVTINEGVTVGNMGLHAVSVRAVTGAITNSGAVTSPNGVNAFQLEGAIGSFTNMATGVITGGGGINGFLGGAATYTNNGTINATNVFLQAFLGGAGTQTFVNSGTITGTRAILLGDGNDILILLPGSNIAGISDGGNNIDTLSFSGTGNGTFNLDDIGGGGNKYLNFETFTVEGGTWTFSGSTTQPFTIKGGTIQGNGNFDQSVTLDGGQYMGSGTVAGAVTLNGGTLSGTGTFNNTVAATNGSTVAPGNSIGTITVNGDFNLLAGSTFLVEVSPTAADKVIVGAGGGVNIANATLRVVELPGSVFNSVEPLTFIIIDQQGGAAVTGTGFSSVTSSLAFSAVTVTTTGGDGNDVAITVTPIVTALVNPNATTATTAATTPVTFASVAHTRNQLSVASALDNGFFAGGIANTDEQEVATSLLGLSAPSARQAYDLLSGEIHAAVSEALLTHGRDFTNALTRRGAGIRVLKGDVTGGAGLLGYAALSDSSADIASLGLNFQPKPQSTLQGISQGELQAENENTLALETWATGIGRITSINSTTGASAVDQSAYGFIGGIDMNIWRGLRAGVAASYSHLDVDLNSRISRADVDSGSVATYASYIDRAFHLFSSASYTYSFVDTDRTIAFGGLNRSADADYNGHQITTYTEAGYTEKFGSGYVQPVLAGRYTWLNRESFGETGAGALNLNARSETDHRFDAIAGLRVSASQEFKGVTLVPQAKAFYTHTFGAVRGNADFTFTGGGTTGIISSNRGRDSLSVGAGLSVVANDRVSGFIDYQTTLSKHVVDNSLKGGLTVKF